MICGYIRKVYEERKTWEEQYIIWSWNETAIWHPSGYISQAYRLWVGLDWEVSWILVLSNRPTKDQLCTKASTKMHAYIQNPLWFSHYIMWICKQIHMTNISMWTLFLMGYVVCIPKYKTKNENQLLLFSYLSICQLSGWLMHGSVWVCFLFYELQTPVFHLVLVLPLFVYWIPQLVLSTRFVELTEMKVPCNFHDHMAFELTWLLSMKISKFPFTTFILQLN